MPSAKRNNGQQEMLWPSRVTWNGYTSNPFQLIHIKQNIKTALHTIHLKRYVCEAHVAHKSKKK